MSGLREVASNIEGPLQEIFDYSTRQMDKCMRKRGLYTSEPTKDGATSKIVDKVWDKIYDKIATIIVVVLFFIISLVLYLFGII